MITLWPLVTLLQGSEIQRALLIATEDQLSHCIQAAMSCKLADGWTPKVGQQQSTGSWRHQIKGKNSHNAGQSKSQGPGPEQKPHTWASNGASDCCLSFPSHPFNHPQEYWQGLDRNPRARQKTPPSPAFIKLVFSMLPQILCKITYNYISKQKLETSFRPLRYGAS